jgi:hypothetical protein
MEQTRSNGMDEQVVLEELYDENYEPTEAGEPAKAGGTRAALIVKAADRHITTPAAPCAEILEYARWLGMDTEREKVRVDAATPSRACSSSSLPQPCRSPCLSCRNCCGSRGQA